VAGSEHWTREELAAWLRLVETPGVGRQSARRLLAACGSPQAIFEASPALWRSLLGPAAAQAMGQPPEGFDRLLECTWRWLQEGEGRFRHLLVLGDADYPAALLQTADPPVALYAQGRLDRLALPSLAIVGSRNPTAQGAETARQFAADLSAAGVVVVSGLAAGIDGAAHEGALTGSGGTVAVLGTGLDHIYPRRHLDLARRIPDAGLLLSEFSLGTSPVAAHFPQRNRIIAGLSAGTLVVEAAVASGSLITARMALEAGREVFAIPGSIHSPQSRGCHALIKQGAKLVEQTQDILDELFLLPRHARPVRGGSVRSRPGVADPATEATTQADDLFPASAPAQSPGSGTAAPADEGPILQALGWSPASLEVLQVRTGQSASELNIRLLELELSGEVARLPGQLFQRLPRA
jgi:DNA processing protein